MTLSSPSDGLQRRRAPKPARPRLLGSLSRGEALFLAALPGAIFWNALIRWVLS